MQARALNLLSLTFGVVGFYFAFPWLSFARVLGLFPMMMLGAAMFLAIIAGGTWIGGFLAALGLVLGIGSGRGAGRNFCLAVLLMAAIRLSLGGGFI